MAGDWIKMRADLRSHPKVVRISSALKADRLRVVGGLHAVWCLFDAHSIDGRLDGYTLEAVDDLIGFSGFAAGMQAVGWLEIDGDSLCTPRFDEHNGQSAKRRATETQRKREERKVSAPDADKKRSREEKRREDKEETPLTPQGGVDGAVGQSPSKAGTVCKAIRAKGVMDVNPSHPELLALIDKGVPVEVFEAAAEKCAKASPPKGLAYLLAVVKRQLGEAAAIAAGPSAASAVADPDSRSAIEAEGVAKGIGKWNEINEQWHLYKARVRGNPRAGMTLDALAGMAAQRQGAH